MEWTENLLQMAFLAGSIFTIAGIIQYIFEPKAINSLYGYRTSSSMQSEERWHFAQKYSAVKMITGGLFLVIISLIPVVVEMNDMVQLIIQPAIILLTVACFFYTTEQALKKRFPKI